MSRDRQIPSAVLRDVPCRAHVQIQGTNSVHPDGRLGARQMRIYCSLVSLRIDLLNIRPQDFSFSRHPSIRWRTYRTTVHTTKRRQEEFLSLKEISQWVEGLMRGVRGSLPENVLTSWCVLKHFDTTFTPLKTYQFTGHFYSSKLYLIA